MLTLSTHLRRTLWVLSVLPVLIFGILTGSTDATTFYVPDDYATLPLAILSAESRDTILVRPGDYDCFVAFGGKRLVVRSTDGPEVTILRPHDQRLPIFALINTEPIDTEISGFTFTGYDSMYTAEPRSIIMIDRFARPRILGCIFRNNYQVRGFNCISAAVTIRNNLFYANTGDFCISLWKGNASILNNTIVDCDGGIVTMAADIEVLNNIIVDCKYYGVKGAIYGLDYNNVWSNGLNYGDGAVPGAHDISVDPLFVDAAARDYHLAAGSPCIDAGHPDFVFNDPDGSRSDMGCYSYQIPTAVDDPEGGLPGSFVLEQNYPNPFNGSTHIAFALPVSDDVKLTIFNVLGQVVTTLVERRLAAGSYDYVWDGTDSRRKPVSSGVYFYRLMTGSGAVTRRMVYSK